MQAQKVGEKVFVHFKVIFEAPTTVCIKIRSYT